MGAEQIWVESKYGCRANMGAEQKKGGRTVTSWLLKNQSKAHPSPPHSFHTGGVKRKTDAN